VVVSNVMVYVVRDNTLVWSKEHHTVVSSLDQQSSG